MSENDQPITGICLVTKHNNVPTGYQCIRKTHDDPSKDADLMADTLLGRKDRFLCITRIYPMANNSALVLEDIKLIGERETSTLPYQSLTVTVDTTEKGTSKRTICVKFVARQAGIKCVCDIIFLCRSKRPPQLYTLIGEINGLQMCIKEGVVPSLRLPPTTGQTSNLYPNFHSNHEPTTPDPSHGNPLHKKSDEKEILDGIPFQMNPKYLLSNRHRHDNSSGRDSFHVLSSYEFEQMFYYDFNLERALK